MKKKFLYVRDRYTTYMYLGSKEYKNKIGYIQFSERNKRFTLYLSGYSWLRVSLPNRIQGNSLQELETFIKLNIDKPKRKIFHFKGHKRYK